MVEAGVPASTVFSVVVVHDFSTDEFIPPLRPYMEG